MQQQASTSSENITSETELAQKRKNLSKTNNID
jgi:hypothetical protein